MQNNNDSMVEQLVSEFNSASTTRSTFESHWEEVSRLVLPAYSGTFTNGGSQLTPGSKRTQSLHDSTAVIALPRFAAVMESMLTPRNSKWHRLVSANPGLKKDRSTRLWMDALTDAVFKYRYASTANFDSQNGQTYLSSGAFGTGSTFIDENMKTPGLRYRSVHLGETYFFEDHQGMIDKAARRFLLSARQAARWFGESRLPDRVKDKIGTNTQDVPNFKFLHWVTPREDRDMERADHKGMEYASYYIALDDKVMVKEGGYSTFPYAVSRHLVISGETYGRSPAMEALPAIKTINDEKKTMLRMGHRTLDPVLLLPNDGILDGFSLKAGALNVGGVTRDGKRLVHELPVGDLVAGEKLMDLERQHIHDAFFITIFQILVDSPEMTATEVIERVREKGVLLSPIMGRHQTEYLAPMIDREIDVLSRQGLIPPMPPALREAGGEYKVEYDSPLSRAQRAEEASGFLRMTETALKVATEMQNPEPLDHFDWDVAIPELADIHAVPERWRRSLDAIQKIRAGRSQQRQTEQAIQAAPAVAAVLKNAPSAIQ